MQMTLTFEHICQLITTDHGLFTLAHHKNASVCGNKRSWADFSWTDHEMCPKYRYIYVACEGIGLNLLRIAFLLFQTPGV